MQVPRFNTEKETLEYISAKKQTMLDYWKKPDPNWQKLETNDPNIELQSLNVEGTAMPCFKIISQVDCSAKFLFSKLWSGGLKWRQQWEPDLVESESLENIDEDNAIHYRKYSFGWLLQRHMIVFNSKAEEKTASGTCYLSFGASLYHSKIDQLGYNSVISTVYLSGIILEPIDKKKTRFIRLVHMDPKISIPTFVAIKKSAAKSQESIKQLQEAISKEISEDVYENELSNQTSEKGSASDRPLDNHHQQNKTEIDLPPSNESFQNRSLVETSSSNVNFSSSDIQSPSVSHLGVQDITQLKENLGLLERSVEKQAKTLCEIENSLQDLKNSSDDTCYELDWTSVTFMVVWPFVVYGVIDMISNSK